MINFTKLAALLVFCLLISGNVMAQNISDSYYNGSPTFSIPNPTVDNDDQDSNDFMFVQTEGTRHRVTVRLLSSLPIGHTLNMVSSGTGSKGTSASGNINPVTTVPQELYDVGGAAESLPTSLIYTLTVPIGSTPVSYDVDLEICVIKTGGGGAQYCMYPSGSASVGQVDEIEVSPDISTTVIPRPSDPDAQGGNIVRTFATAVDIEWTSSGNKSIVVEPLGSFPYGLTAEVTNINCTSGSCGTSTGQQDAVNGPTPVIQNINGTGTATITYVTTVPLYTEAKTESVGVSYTIQ